MVPFQCYKKSQATNPIATLVYSTYVVKHLRIHEYKPFVIATIRTSSDKLLH